MKDRLRSRFAASTASLMQHLSNKAPAPFCAQVASAQVHKAARCGVHGPGLSCPSRSWLVPPVTTDGMPNWVMGSAGSCVRCFRP